MENSNPNSSPIHQQREDSTMSSINCRISEYLYHELYHEILLRLPVKSIQTCKFVCKSWFSIISNPSFMKHHLKRNKNNPSSIFLLLAYSNDMNPISYDSLESSLSIEEIEARAVSLRMLYPPLDLGIDTVRLFGSCNGLIFLGFYDGYEPDTDGSGSGSDIFLSDDEYPEPDHIDGSLPDHQYPDIDGFDDFESFRASIDDKDKLLYVWNPATDEYKEITPPSPDIDFCHNVFITGLSYDGKNDDYKFVIGGWSNGSGLASLLQIFSLRSNSWQTIETPYDFTQEKWKPGVLVNGDLHWLAKRDCGLCIVYLYFCNDIPSFREIQLPTVPNVEFVTVGELEEGCLCVVGHTRDPVSLSRVQVWESKVYGVRESWTKRFVIANDTITRSIIVKDSGSRPIWCLKNGKIVFVDLRRVVVYDPKHGTTDERNLKRLAYFASGANYVESLLSLGSGTYVGNR